MLSIGKRILSVHLKEVGDGDLPYLYSHPLPCIVILAHSVNDISKLIDLVKFTKLNIIKLHGYLFIVNMLQ